MLTGELRNKVDRLWDTFWTGGISNPIEVIEQITYLLFIRALDEFHTREENKAATLGRPMERRIFPEVRDRENDDRIPYEEYRWSRLKNREPRANQEYLSRICGRAQCRLGNKSR
jgi:type I restriction enzyme M protein